MTTTTVNKNMEQKLRRALNKHGYSIRKSRQAIGIDNLGGFMIVDDNINACVGGSRYDLTLDDIADFLKRYCES